MSKQPLRDRLKLSIRAGKARQNTSTTTNPPNPKNFHNSTPGTSENKETSIYTWCFVREMTLLVFPTKELNLLSAASFPGPRWKDLENQILQKATISKFGDLSDAKTMSVEVCYPLPISSAQCLHGRVYIKVPSLPKEGSFPLCTTSSMTDVPLFQTEKLYFLSLLTAFTCSLYPNPACFNALPSPQPF